MKRSVPLLFLLLFIMVNISHAQQGVSINSTGTAANASAMLDVSSTTKGALIPRMTNAQVIAIASPATGLFIYQTDIDSGFYYYSGNRWIQMAAVDTSTKSAWLSVVPIKCVAGFVLEFPPSNHALFVLVSTAAICIHLLPL